MQNKTAISLFCGAGGMDVGFKKAGFEVLWANDFDSDACATYRENLGSHVVCGDINGLISDLDDFQGVDCVFGGPPCQGFSVAGRMDPADERSKLVMSFMEVVEKVQPSSFVMENVKSLGVLDKFKLVRESIFKQAKSLGYHVELLILNSKDFGVPQSRERMFIVGFKSKKYVGSLSDFLGGFYRKSPVVRDVIARLGPAGSENNPKTVKARISLAKNPVLRKSPYAGMLFNGQGRPVDPDCYSSTLHASMGGNRTPIIDEKQLYEGAEGWVIKYHQHLMEGGAPFEKDEAPNFLRRMTVDEAHLLQTFPENFHFAGKQSSVFRQIGNAVPCNLAQSVAEMVMDALNGNLRLNLNRDEVQTLPLAI
ncbi:DNA cytosine methyltransferase [Halomonas garicola]|uniref:DNA cytosine methyltransferase n=1 Tax=Halomonas garicola TaxID=1690008 RepID=UPI00289CB80E|nr:DNA cytosine methyltransferase [Halomonas garicola]